jgi:hypothetical protein
VNTVHHRCHVAVGLRLYDSEMASAAMLVESGERPHVEGIVSFPQTCGSTTGWVPACRVLDWPVSPGSRASADLVGSVDVCRCGRHVGVALLESIVCIDVLCGLGLHDVGKARCLSHSTCNQ